MEREDERIKIDALNRKEYVDREEDRPWYRERRLLVGFLLMVAIGIAMPISLLLNPGSFPVFLIVLLVVFAVWMISFLIKNKISPDGRVLED